MGSQGFHRRRLDNRLKRPARRAGGHAFTLIELLLVVAIVSLLVSLLLPALAGARRAARAIQCGAHLRQLATATAGYLSDHRDTYPQPFELGALGHDQKGRYLWYNALDFYLGEPVLRYRNSGERNHVPVKHDPVWSRLEQAHNNRTLKMNEHLGGERDGTVRWARGIHIAEPTRTVLYGDGRANDLSNESAAFSIPGRFHLRPSYIGLRHNDAANIAFVDGHVERVRQATQTILINSGQEEALVWYDVDDPRQTLLWQID